MWFAPNLTMTGVFSGTVGVSPGLDFWTAFTAMVLGTVVGAVPAAYLGTWGSHTGTGQLPLSRLAFGCGVALPGIMQWLSSGAWDALIGLFGGEALAQLLGRPFWLGALALVPGQVSGAVLLARGGGSGAVGRHEICRAAGRAAEGAQSLLPTGSCGKPGVISDWRQRIRARDCLEVDNCGSPSSDAAALIISGAGIVGKT
ncbi:putative NCS1 family transporter [Streptomyces lydicamycinicus]|uniref:Putative NCS1 family transporter n=1 Tax=Streptomyces lydicamycinicus TaxID=1546107 RepID=A0A0P4R5E2_9ACTN|nr:putative NCS1 family transporter [Streptomyces lydicamycinicus]